MQLSERTRTTIAMLVLPIAVLGVLARNLVARAAPAQGGDVVDEPVDWVPFQAKVTISHPGTPSAHGRYFRKSDGSERLETGPSEADIKVIMIRNVSEGSLYLFGSEGWTREPFNPVNNGRPIQWRKGLPNWVMHPYRLALRRGESGSLTADRGLTAYRVTTGQGVVTYKVPELNLFDVVRQRPDGRYEIYSDIELVEPSPDLFDPPVGAAVQDRGTRELPSHLEHGK